MFNAPATSDQRPATSSFARGVSIALGSLLIVAASLKIAGGNVSPLPGVGWLSLPGVQLTVVVLELLIGVGLIFDIAKPLNWLAAVLLFGMFSVVSAYLGLIGQANCGCFGTIEASPWTAFAVDLLAVTALVIVRPRRESWQSLRNSNRIRTTSKLLGGAALVMAVLALGSSYAFGSLAAAVAKLRGDSLYASSYLDFGSADPGEKLEHPLEVSNLSSEPIRLIGGTSDCSCVTTSAMPLTIAPGESIAITIHLKVPQSDPGAFTRTASLWTDCESQRTISFRLGCRVK